MSHDESQFSHSSLSLYRDCGIKYKYDKLTHLVPRSHRIGHDLRFGSAGHEAMAALYSGASIKDVGNAFKLAYPVEQYPDPLPSVSQGKTQENFLAMLWAYINTQWKDDCANWEVLEVERPQVSEGLGQYDHMLVLDLIVRDKMSGEILGVDHKFTGKYLKDIWSKYEFHSQVMMYAEQIRRRFGQCSGFIVNAFSLRNRSKAYTPRRGNEPNPRCGKDTECGNRCNLAPNHLGDCSRSLPAGDWFSFGRMLYTPDANHLAIEQRNVQHTIDKIRHDILYDSFTYNTDMCFAGTPWECQYYPLCKSGYTWPRDEYQITENFKQVCYKQIAGESRCHRDMDHSGDCDEAYDSESSPANIIIIEPEDDPYYMSISE